MKTKTKKPTPTFYNISGAAWRIGRSPSTILQALGRGDLIAAHTTIGSSGKRFVIIDALELASYRDLIVERLRVNGSTAKDAKAIKALQAIKF